MQLDTKKQNMHKNIIKTRKCVHGTRMPRSADRRMDGHTYWLKFFNNNTFNDIYGHFVLFHNDRALARL